MAEFQLTLTAEEQTYLARILKTALGETRSEVHRTHTPGYREQVQDEEKLIRAILAKLGPA